MNAEVSIEGSGICRHRVWRFDYQGFTQVTELACYGEVDPPETATGYISFDRDAPYTEWFWCHL